MKFEPEKFFKNLAKPRGKIDYLTIEPVKDNVTKIIAGGWIGKKSTEMEAVINIHFNKQMCPTDGKLSSGYYESKIQLRGGVQGDVLEAVEHEFNTLVKKDKKAFFRHELVKDGVDIFIGSKQAARRVADMLEQKFDAEVKKSFQLVSHKDGKDITRETFSVRFKGVYEPVSRVL